jgi:hypothetical protein
MMTHFFFLYKHTKWIITANGIRVVSRATVMTHLCYLYKKMGRHKNDRNYAYHITKIWTKVLNKIVLAL